MNTREFLCIACFPRLRGIYPSPQRQNYPWPVCIRFWYNGKDFLTSIAQEWTIWTGIRKRDNIVGKVPSKTVHFVSVSQVNTCRSFISKINGSLDWNAQHLILLDRTTIFPSLLCNQFILHIWQNLGRLKIIQAYLDDEAWNFSNKLGTDYGREFLSSNFNLNINNFVATFGYDLFSPSKTFSA